jgi:translocator protein
MEWYDSLIKPAWTPAPGVIGTIWTLLYPIIIVVFGYVIFRVVRGTMPLAVLVPLGINVVANVAFTPIQFGLRNLGLASFDIAIVLITIVWCMIAFWPYAKWASMALVPYLVWVATATTLQFSISWLNR